MTPSIFPVSCLYVTPRPTICFMTEQNLSASVKEPIVVAESLFVKIPEQMEWLYVDIGPVKATLQEAPEVLHCVGMDVAVHVLGGMVYDGVLVIGLQAIVGFEL